MRRHMSAIAKPSFKVELGAGSRTMEGWISVDAVPGAIVQCDCANEPLPFKDNSIDEVHSSHFLKHFSCPEPMSHVLRECMRVLRPGELMRVAVPDAAIYIKAYMEHRDFPEVIPRYEKAFFFNSPIDSINYIA